MPIPFLSCVLFIVACYSYISHVHMPTIIWWYRYSFRSLHYKWHPTQFIIYFQSNGRKTKLFFGLDMREISEFTALNVFCLFECVWIPYFDVVHLPTTKLISINYFQIVYPCPSYIIYLNHVYPLNKIVSGLTLLWR